MNLSQYQKQTRKQFAKNRLKHYGFILFMNVSWLAVLILAMANNN